MTAELLQDREEKQENITQQQPVEQKKETDEDRNWKAFLEKRKEEQRLFDAEKEKNKRLEEERAKREKEIEDLKTAFQVMLEKKESGSSFPDDEQTDHKKFVQDEIQRLFREEKEKRKAQEESERAYRDTMAIKQEMPDLVEVCSQENLAYLEYYHPEIAIPLGKMPDGLEKTKLAYQAIKKHVKMAKKEKEKIEQNLSKPKSVHSSYSNETTSDKENSSGVLSDKRRNETWQKMQRLISGEDEE